MADAVCPVPVARLRCQRLLFTINGILALMLSATTPITGRFLWIVPLALLAGGLAIAYARWCGRALRVAVTSAAAQALPPSLPDPTHPA